MRRFAVIALIGVLAVSMAHAQGNGNGNGNGRGAGDCGGQPGSVAELPYQTVDETEQDDLVFMREEEKLARDVYRALDDLWGMRVFRNIAGAEQTHMNRVGDLLVKYEIPDPVGDAGAGEFANPELQTLFNELIAQGSLSLIDALVVGATIEDLDIHDLELRLERTDNEDIRTVYQNLQKGSRNHLRAFASLLADSGVPYEPQQISQEQFDAIVGTPQERGRLDADGNSLNCPRQGGGQRHHRHGRAGHGSGAGS